ncbi:hypothetical protein EV193_12021 [Herbihabitans rhizosphaerae]|uniref:Uncharacterized protein n=1 Tax=Herbihabitans rhizosphaerae TaxID=1872711 RepID=A0A4Q7KAV6_9PSEU|nr:hypothetical protein [Herbihabitans rhizosphaerae]RZS29536.1 hypothetical protein EV193_12021 [Herbihabitans rhizosphaerae]
MSVYAYLVCDKNKRFMYLGKPVRDEDDSINRFSAGPGSNSANVELTKSLWKFLADNADGTFRVVYDHGREFDMITENYVEIGNDAIGAIDFPDYIRDWHG